MKYREYIKSEEWEINRIKHLFEYNECFLCGSKLNLHVHHIRYINLGNEQDGDLVTVCKYCHYKFHFSNKRFRKFFKRQKNRFLKGKFVYRIKNKQKDREKIEQLHSELDKEFENIVR